MSRNEEFNPWQWDRENARAGKAKLTINRDGHEVTLDHRGVSIDGRRVLHDDPSKGEHGFGVDKDGTVKYRDQAIAAIEHSEDGPATVRVWGKNGQSLAERREEREKEEAERQKRDERYRGSGTAQQQIDYGAREVS